MHECIMPFTKVQEESQSDIRSERQTDTYYRYLFSSCLTEQASMGGRRSIVGQSHAAGCAYSEYQLASLAAAAAERE